MWGGTPHFGSGMKTASAALLWHPPVPGDRALAHASGVVAALAQTFGPGARAIEGGTPSGHTPAVCEPPHSGACPLYVFPAKVVSKSATLLRIRALPVPWSTGCAYGCHLLRAVRIGRMGICVHSTLWRQFLIGMQPDVASGRCACSCACVLRASPASIAR